MGRKPLSLVKPICDVEGCAQYGQPHDRCRAHRKGQPCRSYPMKGQFVCATHGGRTGVAKQRGEQRQALTEIGKLVQFDPDDDEPIEVGLLREVRWSSQVAQAYGAAVQALQDEALTQPGKDTRRLNVWIEAWTNERITHAKLAKMALDAGIARRSVELAETQAGQIVAIVIAVLSAQSLGLSAEQIVMGKQVAAETMRALPHGT